LIEAGKELVLARDGRQNCFGKLKTYRPFTLGKDFLHIQYQLLFTLLYIPGYVTQTEIFKLTSGPADIPPSRNYPPRWSHISKNLPEQPSKRGAISVAAFRRSLIRG